MNLAPMADWSRTFQSFVAHARWIYKELGISSLYHTGIDAWLIITTRTSRMFAFGAASLTIALYFSALGFSDYYIGVFMTLTLLGDVVLSYMVTMVADNFGRRRILLGGALFMILSGLVFAIFENFWILLIAAIIGVVSATGSDVGPFRAIEESTLSHLTSLDTRSDVLSWYVTTSSLGSAAGTELAGRAVDYLQNLEGWMPRDAYKATFWLYAVIGVLNAILILFLSKKCEAQNRDTTSDPSNAATSSLLGEEDEVDTLYEQTNMRGQGKSSSRKMLAHISAETRTIMYKLWFLLTVDTMADGMVSYSLTNFYLDRKFQISKATLGDVASISYVLSSCSTIFAGPLARHIGLINTMVFTHLPSSMAVLLFPVPRSFYLTIALFFIRTGLNNMDQAPRAAFIAAVVKPQERTAVMGIAGVLRMLGAAIGPSITGSLAQGGKFWIAFVAAGVLRISYDIGLFVLFVNMKLGKHEDHDRFNETNQQDDEEELQAVTSQDETY